MSKTRLPLLATALVVLLCAGAAHAQFGTGELGQQTRRGMEQAFDNLLNDGLDAPDPKALGEVVGQEKVDAFLAGAVVKLTFMPDGAFKASALEGGEVIFFKLGKAKFTPEEDEEYNEGWLIRNGEFETPKKAQKLSLKLKAGPNEVDVDCHNKYGPSEDPVTFYVGPLDGLFCVGFTESEESDAEMG